MAYFIICRPEPPYFSELLFTARSGNDKIEAKWIGKRDSGIIEPEDRELVEAVI